MLVLSKIISSSTPSPRITGVKYPYLTCLNLKRSTMVFAVYQSVLTDGCLIVYLRILFSKDTVTDTPRIMLRNRFGWDRYVVHIVHSFHILFCYNILLTYKDI